VLSKHQYGIRQNPFKTTDYGVGASCVDCAACPVAPALPWCGRSACSWVLAICQTAVWWSGTSL